jgi:hypothetical protein
MNGYELAERLEDATENFTCIYNISAATKLRQQQAEIEALKQSKFKDDNKVNLKTITK